MQLQFPTKASSTLFCRVTVPFTVLQNKYLSYIVLYILVSTCSTKNYTKASLAN